MEEMTSPSNSTCAPIMSACTCTCTCTHLGGRCSDQGGIDGASCLTERNRDIPTVTMVTIVTMVTTITMVTNVVVVTRLNPLI